MQPTGRPQNVNPEELAPARGFSHATVAGDTVWIGGQVGSDKTGSVVEPGDVVAQFARAIRNVAIALRAAGCRPEDTVKLTYYVPTWSCTGRACPPSELPTARCSAATTRRRR